MVTKKGGTKKKAAATGKEKSVHHKLDKELTDIMKTLKQLRARIVMTQKAKWGFNKWTSEALRKITESSSEVVESATDVLEKAMKFSQVVTLGALEGARKAIDEQAKQEEAPPKRKKKTATTAKKKPAAKFKSKKKPTAKAKPKKG